MKQYRSLFGNRNFLLLWLAGAISNIGDFFNSVALVKILAEDPAHLGLMMALVMTAKSVPGILLGPIAGVVADRLPRRTIMVVSDLLRAGLVAGLVFTHSPAVIVLLVFLAASVSQFFNPASGALLPNLVSKEELVTASSLQFITGRTAQLLGNAIGAVVLMLVGAHNVFYIDAASFLISAAMLSAMLLPAAARTAAAISATGANGGVLRKLVTDLKEMMAYLRQAPAVRGLITGFSLAAVGDSAFQVLLITFITITLGVAAENMGFVWALFGGASVLGALAVGALGGKVHWRHLISYGAIYVWMMAVGALTTASFVPSVTFLTLIGLGSGVINVGANAAMGILIPNQVRGRLFGAFSMIQNIIYVVGMLLAGWFSDRFGPVPVLLGFTSTYLITGPYAFYAFRPKVLEEAGATPSPAPVPEGETA